MDPIGFRNRDSAPSGGDPASRSTRGRHLLPDTVGTMLRNLGLSEKTTASLNHDDVALVGAVFLPSNRRLLGDTELSK